MVLALKELSIRDDISTTVDNISRLIELEDFIEYKIDYNTAWLDGIIKDNVEGTGGMATSFVQGTIAAKITIEDDGIFEWNQVQTPLYQKGTKFKVSRLSLILSIRMHFS